MRYAPTTLAGRTFAVDAAAYGFTVKVNDHGGTGGCVLTLERSFPAGEVAAYHAAEADAVSLLALVPRTAYGSTWGTTSDGVGGHAGLTAGEMILNASGVSKRFASGVRQAIARQA